MGGDHGPAVVLAGAEIARVRQPDLRFLFFGRDSAMAPVLAQYPKLQAVSTLVHTDVKVEATDKPSQALRQARSSSMGLAIQAVKDGRAQAAVSAGNTGALMAMAKVTLRTMEGIERPALVTMIPTASTASVMLDLGANTECDVENLVQFAFMGAAFARTTLGVGRPRVALLNIGVEDMKGTEEIREAAQRLRAMQPPFDFIGYVEGDKIGAGEVDVIVTDGFTGNVALKTVEGTARLIGGLLGNAFRHSLWSRIGYLFASAGIRALRDHLDPNNHNGAVFLGLNGLVVKSHGSANANGIATAIGLAHDLIRDDTPAIIARDVAGFHLQAAPASAAIGA